MFYGKVEWSRLRLDSKGLGQLFPVVSDLAVDEDCKIFKETRSNKDQMEGPFFRLLCLCNSRHKDRKTNCTWEINRITILSLATRASYVALQNRRFFSWLRSSAVPCLYYRSNSTRSKRYSTYH